MKLRGQHGYAMAALLVGMSVLAILLTAAMPTWRQMVRRDKEAELVFRGEQYARAIGLYQKKAGPGVLPTNLDVLIDQKYLRKKYKDPITGEDFDLLRISANTPGGGPGAGSPGGAQQAQQPSIAGATGAGGIGGIQGVASKSKDESLLIYNGRTHYNEWQFVFVPQTQAAGDPGGGAGGRGGGRGGAPQNPGTSGPGVNPARGGGAGRGGPGGGMSSPPPGRGGPFAPAGPGASGGPGRGR